MRAQAVLLVLLVGAPARAQLRDAKALAQEHLDQGLKYYNTQDYDRAIDEWKQAYLLDADTNTLFGIGQAQRLKGDCRAAAETYRTVLREGLPDKQAAEVKRVLGLCEEQLKKGEKAPPAAAAPSPAPEPSPAPAAAAPAPEPEPETPEPSPWYTDWLGDTLAVLAIAGVAGGATFYVLAGQAEDDAQASPQYDDFADQAETAELDRKIMIGSFIAGGAFAIGAAIRWSARDPGGHATVSATPAAGGGIVVVGGSF